MKKLKPTERLSLNQITTEQWNLKEAVEGCAKANIPYISLWRHKIEEIGLKESSRLVRDAGLGVSSVCRGGMFPVDSDAAKERNFEDNLRAIEEAYELNADVLVLVCGAAVNKNIGDARKIIREGIERLVPYAKDAGIKLGIEPLHPMFAAERCAIVTLDEANTIAEQYDANNVGVVVDVYHVWWDPNLYEQIKRATGRILGYHVSDWLVPTPDMVKGRGMMGDGVIELMKIRQAVEEAGYMGPIEVEIFNEEIWKQDGHEVLAQMKERYAEYV